MRDGTLEKLDRAHVVVELALVAFLAAGLFLSIGIGLADNGDYTRAMGWLTSGPATMEPNWPAPGTDAWNRRFSNFWIPYWKLDWPLAPDILTSNIVLWLPGAVLNWLFYSRTILYLPVMSLVPRALLLLLYVGVLRWDGWRAAGRAACWTATLVLGVPLALVLMSVHYVRYFNTFYRDTGTMVFLLAFLAALARLDAGRRARRDLILAGVALALLGTAKVANIYWPFLALPFLLLARGGRRQVAPVCAVLAVTVSIALILYGRAERADVRDYAAYSSLYTGVLPWSARPHEHLARLGLAETADFVGRHIYETPAAVQWVAAHPGRLSHRMTLDIVLHEPRTALRGLAFATRAMHNTVVLSGERAEFDPTPRSHQTFPQLWGVLKKAAFPRGPFLLATFAVFAAVFARGLLSEGPLRAVSLVGLAATVGSLAEMWIQVVAAGTPDMSRHLLIANFLFDLAVVLFGTACVLWVLRMGRGPGEEPPIDQRGRGRSFQVASP